MKSLDELFLHTLQDIYHGEKQILRALPRMAKKTKNPQLAEAFETHRDETQGQIDRLERIFELLDRKARGKPCEAIQGLVEEGKEVMEEAEDPAVMDAGMIAAAQAIEHYEISRYGTLRAWAEQLGMDEAAKLLQETLDEEKKTDELLNQLALSSANQKAEKGGSEQQGGRKSKAA